MQRWHEDVLLMLRRWLIEVDNHRNRTFNFIEGDCHCLRGKGTMRKVRPFGHNRRCYMCRGPKYFQIGRPWKDGTAKRGRANWLHVVLRHEEVANS